MREQERVYTTKEISDYLDIGTSTLRKWCLSLEENDYKFIRTDNNKRLFFERDLIALKYYKKLVQTENFSLGNASKTVTSRHKGEASETRTPTVIQGEEGVIRSPMHSDEMIQQLLDYMKKQDEHIKRQEKFNCELLDRLDKQQKYIEERLNERNEKLIQSLREVQETKQLIVAAYEENKNTTKRFWVRLFGK